jgi:uncharacterized protein (DUF1499 family)
MRNKGRGRRIVSWIVVAIIAFLGLGMAAVRLAPVDPARWHVAVEAEEDRDMAGGAVRVIPAEDGMLTRLDAIAQATPRTSRIAGSPEEGRITWQTRSLIWGFPDYTTAEVSDGRLKIFARLRFGQSDLGVNRARLEAWLSQL